jgi:UDP-N-acetyl-D-glucosamine/UDP-N-acetyl-D-galactosamine dehydrogenase
MIIKKESLNICVVGMGYVGLPLAVEFGKEIPTIGFDIKADRINELKKGTDSTLEVSDDELKDAVHLTYTKDLDDTRLSNVYIITVPTPVDDFKNPDLSPLIAASKAIGSVLKKGDYVIYESTVYPGATEEVCVPELEKSSGLTFNEGFYVGYSPERINPGDKVNRLPTILKITSGSTPEAADFVDSLYQMVITAGTYKAESIKVAEAAKVIENTQRDVNIALINELSLIFEKLGIDTLEVLEAAGTKWNFLPFRPGLVGGHCIGIDHFYLMHKAEEIGFHPRIIQAARRINDEMGSYVSERVIKLMLQKKIHIVDSNILIMGLTFKENCPDIRNTRTLDIYNELLKYNANVSFYDPWVDADEAKNEYGIEMLQSPEQNSFDAIILAVAHDEFKEMGITEVQNLCKSNKVIFDVKNIFSKNDVDGRL